jgi:hypothetical protein
MGHLAGLGVSNWIILTIREFLLVASMGEFPERVQKDETMVIKVQHKTSLPSALSLPRLLKKKSHEYLKGYNLTS